MMAEQNNLFNNQYATTSGLENSDKHYASFTRYSEPVTKCNNSQANSELNRQHHITFNHRQFMTHAFVERTKMLQQSLRKLDARLLGQIRGLGRLLKLRTITRGNGAMPAFVSPQNFSPHKFLTHRLFSFL